MELGSKGMERTNAHSVLVFHTLDLQKQNLEKENGEPDANSGYIN